ncbi:hypothetical protein JOE58_002972 [Curtobacterium luteum]|uniref:DUF4166 domain-containing protein n=1 Tax=Curtobacterium luteum TaxID=33881 RepID=A0A8H9GBT0_9MICO|nr:DUF4166 domain-containing protein [Curtobacterium luteum]MBM7803721.1 hypothetical protein [Curtobacterium luteum]NUU51554.1 DUF4166 domain-containing protein [Curtobacterium luteum]GGL02987.1 hypothetical protein GCM10009769_21440 [Curtobacterium luteum]
MSRSPYELSTPADALARLHPRLRTYFGPVPVGHVGRGSGVFDVVGTPRRWLWPLLAWFARDAVMFPVCERNVPFTVENRPVRVGRGPGPGDFAVRAHRTFRFRFGDRTMVDAITAGPDGLVDHLGRRGRVSARLRAEVPTDGPDAGALRLVSTHVAFRALGREWGLPAVTAPRVTLVERFDDDADLQRVSLVLAMPVLGTLYRYEGAFSYSVVPEGER